MEDFSKEAVRSLLVEDYRELRGRLATGMLMFASGEYWVSRRIRKATNSCWSHVGVIYVDDAIQRVMLLESVESMGVRMVPISKYLLDYEDGKPYRGEIILATSGMPNPFEGIKAGVDLITRPYNRSQYLSIVAAITFGGTVARSKDAYICSELVGYCMATGGIVVKQNNYGYLSPKDVWRDWHVKLHARIW